MLEMDDSDDVANNSVLGMLISYMAKFWLG